MSVSDPIGDMLTAIRNAAMARKEKVVIAASNLKKKILDIFKKYGYVRDYRELEDGRQGLLEIYLNYIDGKPSFIEVVRISKPGRRVYVSAEDVPNIKRGIGIAVISTSKGVITNKEARRQKIGGEYICYIY